MPFIAWSDKYSVKVEEMDLQHQKLLAMLNDLHDSMKQGKSKGVVGSLVTKMLEYASQHLDREEALMRNCGYEGLSEHKKKHDQFRQKVSEFQTALNSTDHALSQKMMAFFKEWFITHICEEDKRYFLAINSCTMAAGSGSDGKVAAV